MAFQKGLQTHTIPASADLSGSQYKLCKTTTGSQLQVCDTRGERFIGVLQGKTTGAGQSALYAWGGISKLEAGDSSAGTAIVYGTPLMTSSAGRGVPSTGIGQYAGAFALDTLSSGETAIISAMITLGGMSSS